MKRVAICILVLMLVTLIASSFACPVAAAESATTGVAYDYFEFFAGVYSDRTVSTQFEVSAAKWLASKLYSFGYRATMDNPYSLDTDMMHPFQFSYQEASGVYSANDVQRSSYNVVGYKSSGKENASLLVIVAPYSNEKQYVIGQETLGLDDAAYSASSVGALLAVAERLSKGDWSFDLAIVFTGADYFNMSGTAEFLQSTERDILGFIYLSQVGVGDDLNVYYDEVERTHGKFADAYAKRNRYAIESKPFDPGYDLQVYGGNLPYSHVGISGGNYVAMQMDIPAMHLFGYCWAGGMYNGESSRHDSIVFTTDDNLDKFVSLYGKDTISARLDLTVNFVCGLVGTDEEFANALSSARNDASYKGLVSDTLSAALRWTAIGIAVLAMVIIGVLLIKRSQSAGNPDFVVNRPYGAASRPEPQEDVFGEYGTIDGEGTVDGGDPVAGESESKSGDAPDSNDIFGEF